MRNIKVDTSAAFSWSSGCTTSSDHHYLHPVRAGDLLGAEIQAAQDLGMRFHPTYGSIEVGGELMDARRKIVAGQVVAAEGLHREGEIHDLNRMSEAASDVDQRSF